MQGTVILKKLNKYILSIGAVLVISLAFFMGTSTSTNSLVYVQASKGSFNDAAITQLFSLMIN